MYWPFLCSDTQLHLISNERLSGNYMTGEKSRLHSKWLGQQSGIRSSVAEIRTRAKKLPLRQRAADALAFYIIQEHWRQLMSSVPTLTASIVMRYSVDLLQHKHVMRECDQGQDRLLLAALRQTPGKQNPATTGQNILPMV